MFCRHRVFGFRQFRRGIECEIDTHAERTVHIHIAHTQMGNAITHRMKCAKGEARGAEHQMKLCAKERIRDGVLLKREIA